MTLEERYQSERKKWDEIAQDTWDEICAYPPDSGFLKYASRDNSLTGVAEFIGRLKGKRVLDYGCGLGYMTVRMALDGAEVTAFDLSRDSLAMTARLASINNVSSLVSLTVSAGEKLSFAEESFDVVFGKSILHHLVPEISQPELYRVLKKGGKAVFSEPLGMNPVLTFVRKHVRYADKNTVGVDKPLTYKDLLIWSHGFSEVHVRELQLISMLERGLKSQKMLPVLRRLDNYLLRRFSFLRRYCRIVVVGLVK